jgi:hypothetical protein
MVKNVHWIKKNRIKESHTVRISSVEQRNNQSLIHKANRRRRRRRRRAKEGRLIDKKTEKKKREKERNTKERNTNLMVTLLLLFTLSLEAKLLLGEEEASAKLFPDDKVDDLVPETCAATGTTQAVTVTLTADTHDAISLLPLSVLISFLLTSLATGNTGRRRVEQRKRISFFWGVQCSKAERERGPRMCTEGETGRGAKQERERTGSNSSGKERGALGGMR